MGASLFRRQALEHQKDRLHGEVLVLPSLPHLIITLVVGLWMVCLLAWLVSSSYARQVTVTGYLEPPDGIVRLYAQPAGGRIEHIFVKDGQLVKIGQPLMTISISRELVTGDSLGAKLREQYEQQQESISAQLNRRKDIHRLHKVDLDQQIVALDQDLERLSAQINTVQKRQELINKRVDNFRSIRDMGHIANLEFDKIREQQLALQNEQQALLRERINQQNTRQKIVSQRKILPDQYLNDVSVLKTKLSDLALNITQLNSQQAYVVKATREGRVTNLQSRVGQQLSPSAKLLSIVPSHHNVEVKLLIPVRSAGFIQPDQQLDIRYDAFPYQKFGIYQAKVAHISDGILLPDELRGLPLSANEPVYMVTAVLTSNKVNAYGKQLLLKAGMTLTADIQLSERSLLEWLLEPIYSLQGRL